MLRTDDGTPSDLVARLKASDRSAWAELITRYTKPLLQIVPKSLPRSVRQKVDDEDVVQEVFRDLFAQACRQPFPCNTEAELGRLLTVRVAQRIRHEVRKFLAARRDVRRESSCSSSRATDDQGWAEPVHPEPNQERGFSTHDEFLSFVSTLDLCEQVVVHLRLELGTLQKVADALEWSLRKVQGLWQGVCAKARKRSKCGRSR